ncbi:unnamed protein product [Nesidiocoris tenuis]|uniref:Uncharacterized protein n=1 Tax=Nesidiocoris tenuis TaxID=355587 RepID=A0A6H5G5V3_9HEMI|nr:unnamed protein product [Nesidiocoris tenuis]
MLLRYPGRVRNLARPIKKTSISNSAKLPVCLSTEKLIYFPRLFRRWDSQRQLPAQFGCGGPLSRAARPVQTARRIEIGLQQRSLELEASLVHSDDRPYQLHSSRNLKKASKNVKI